MSEIDVEDVELIARSQQGDSAAFGDLYVKYMTPVYQYVYYRVHLVEEAEDLTEMVFMKAWEAIDRFQQRNIPFLVWLYRIAHNQVIDHVRKKSFDTVDVDTQIQLADKKLSPEDIAVVNSRLEEVMGALHLLEPDQQEVITLRFVNGLSYQEVAEVMGRPASTIRVLQHRALKALQRWLKA